MSLLAALRGPWRTWLRDTWEIVRLTSVPATITVLAALALSTLEQSLESVRAIAEEAQAGRPTGLGLVFAAALLSSFMAWYWSRITLRVVAPVKPSMSRESRRARLIAPYLWGFVPWVGLAAACYQTGASWPADGDSVRQLLLWCAVGALGSGVVLALVAGWIQSRRRPEPEVSATERHRRIRALPRLTLLFLCATEAGWFLFMVLTVPTHGQGVRLLNPPALVLLAVVIWIPAVSFLGYLGARWRLPVLRIALLLAVLWATLSLNDNHLVRSEETTRPPKLQDFGAAFTSWLKGRADLGDYDPYPVFFVATEGGGLRAAYFTALVLTALQDQCPAFAQHTFAISGVSGGSVGATIFGALAARSARNLPRQPCLDPGEGRGRMQRTADSILSHDLLTPLVGMGLFPDLFQRFLPFRIPSWDRALGLEVGLEKAWSDVVGDTGLAQPFGSLWKDFSNQAVPALLLNSTRVTTGERVLISPLYPLDERFNRLVTLQDLIGGRAVRLSTAAFLSSRFPLITPEGELPRPAGSSAPPERLVDGGYFENSGATTLSELLASLRVGEPNQDTTRPRFLPVVIRIGFAVEDRPGGDSATKFTATALSEVLTPVRALLNVRGARGSSAVHQLSTAITTLQDRQVPAELIEFQLTSGSVPLVLGWLMSARARQEMTAQLGRARECGEIQAVRNDCSQGSVRQVLGRRVPDRTARGRR